MVVDEKSPLDSRFGKRRSLGTGRSVSLVLFRGRWTAKGRGTAGSDDFAPQKFSTAKIASL